VKVYESYLKVQKIRSASVGSLGLRNSSAVGGESGDHIHGTDVAVATGRLATSDGK
jgi:hypothetical protein